MNLIDNINPAKWSLSRKFISIVLLILIIPFASVGILKEIEKTLESNLLDRLLLSSRIISNQLAQNQVWFEESLLPDSKQYLAKELFVFPLNNSFELDGYFEDWQGFEQHRKIFSQQKSSQQQFNQQQSSQQPSSFGVLLGSVSRYFIVSIEVKDLKVIYSDANSDRLSDQIEIEFKTQNNRYQKIYLNPQSPGNFPVKIVKDGKLRIDWRYKASWVETVGGFNLELKFPSGFRPREIRITHQNIDQLGQSQYQQSHSSSFYDLNPLVWPSSNLVRYFSNVDIPDGQRIWLLDTHGRVLAMAGTLQINEISYSRNPLFNWLLTSQTDNSVDPRKNHLHLDSEDIYVALKGQVSKRIENIRNSGQSIALAALPIVIKGEIFGVLLLEENIAQVQILQKKTLIRMFLITLVVFLLVMWIIFWYVSRMVGRIRYLNDSIEKVVDQQGRMTSPLSLKIEKGDEIDELYRAFSHMGTKLFEYNDHLEKLASRLSHELRTPIAIVRSSLDNLLLSCQNKEDEEIINRALQGNQRLGEIISRMRQSSGVKEAMQTAEKEAVDLELFLQQVINGYQLSFSQFEFVFECSIKQKSHSISIDLFAEMLDKLIANAMEFCYSNTPIIISLTENNKTFKLAISNSGPMIPKKNSKRIFHSLVSIRTNQQATGTNLGLGLYVVRLIAEFHNATVKAQNRKDESGVIFIISW